MSRVFADTFYYLALLNKRDGAHARALEVSESVATRTMTTAWVLAEVGDAMAETPLRPAFPRFVDSLRANPNVVVLPAGPELFEDGLALYRRYADKEWSLTDCISFTVMRRHRLNAALTGDHHFVQAGFKALLA
jgi:predicted nucleic acid-binding protein